MALQSSGQITHTDIATEFGYATGNFSLNADGAVILTGLGDNRTVGSSQVKESDFYNLSAVTGYQTQGYVIGGSLVANATHPPVPAHATTYRDTSSATATPAGSPSIGKSGKNFSTIGTNATGLVNMLAQPLSSGLFYGGSNFSGAGTQTHESPRQIQGGGPTGFECRWVPNSGQNGTTAGQIYWFRCGSQTAGDYKFTFNYADRISDDTFGNSRNRNDGNGSNIINFGLHSFNLLTYNLTNLTQTFGATIYVANSANTGSRFITQDISAKSDMFFQANNYAFSEDFGNEDRFEFSLTGTTDICFGIKPRSNYEKAQVYCAFGFVELWKKA